MKREHTRAKLNAAARQPQPMRRIEYVPPPPLLLEITELRPAGMGPWRLYQCDDFDNDFMGGRGTLFASWDEALTAVKSIGVGMRAYLDNATGACVLKVVNPMR